MSRTAVVFDSAGTLVEMYRVARDTVSDTFIPDSDNLRIVSEMIRSCLVVLDVPAENILRQPCDRLLSEWMAAENISFGVAFSKNDVCSETVSDAVKRSKIPIGALQETVKKASIRFTDPVYAVSGFIADVEKMTIPYLMSTGGALFDNAAAVIDSVRKTGADIYIASGDDPTNVFRVADRLRIPKKNVNALCRAEHKEKIVAELQTVYDRVFMVGDGLNDRQALEKADLGILISRENYYTPDILKRAADVIVRDLGECPEIIREAVGAGPKENDRITE